MTFMEWAQGQDIALEFRVLGIDGELVAVQPVFRAGQTDIWAGRVENLMVDHGITLTGFTMQGGDLVIKNLGVIL